MAGVRAGIHTTSLVLDDIPGLPWNYGESVRRKGSPRRWLLHAGPWRLTGGPRQPLFARRDHEPLLHPSDIGVEVVGDLQRELLRCHGVELTSEPLVAQAEIAVDQSFQDGAAGLAYLEALAEAELPRLTRGRFDKSRIRSVDWRQPTAGRIVVRAYDHGAGHAGRLEYAQPGEVIRIEVVGRWPAGRRREATSLSGATAREWAADVWVGRAAALASSVDGRLLRTADSLERLLFRMADEDRMNSSDACRYLGNALWVASGRAPTRGIQKQIRQLRENHGIRIGTSGREEAVRLGFAELIEQVRENPGVWGALPWAS